MDFCKIKACLILSCSIILQKLYFVASCTDAFSQELPEDIIISFTVFPSQDQGYALNKDLFHFLAVILGIVVIAGAFALHHCGYTVLQVQVNWLSSLVPSTRQNFTFDWLRHLAPVSQPIKKTNCELRQLAHISRAWCLRLFDIWLANFVVCCAWAFGRKHPRALEEISTTRPCPYI